MTAYGRNLIVRGQVLGIHIQGTPPSYRGLRLFVICGLAALLFMALVPSISSAHGFAGKRFFPTTFQVDNPFISDEFSFVINHIKGPNATTTEIDIGYSKRILPKLGLEFHEAYLHQRFNEGGSANGWDNFGVGAKWQFLTDEKHELIMSVGTDIDIGGTGAKGIGASSFSTISPGIFFGKGFEAPAGVGKFPETFCYYRCDQPELPYKERSGHAHMGTYRSVQSCLSSVLRQGYRAWSAVQSHGACDRVSMSTCMNRGCNGQTTGPVNPGIVWFTKYMELGIAAQIPVNERTGNSVGVLGLVHVFIDDLFPNSLGKPIFGNEF